MKKKIWKFRLQNTYQTDLTQYIGYVEDCSFFDMTDNVPTIVGWIYNGVLTILAGYEWDGCTPKISLFGQYIGVPDFKKTYEASLVHDFLIEYCFLHNIPRIKIDILFEKKLKEKKFILTFIYAGGVHFYRPVSKLFNKCKKP